MLLCDVPGKVIEEDELTAGICVVFAMNIKAGGWRMSCLPLRTSCCSGYRFVVLPTETACLAEWDCVQAAVPRWRKWAHTSLTNCGICVVFAMNLVAVGRLLSSSGLFACSMYRFIVLHTETATLCEIAFKQRFHGGESGHIRQ